MSTQPPNAGVSASDRMGLTLFVALVIHAMLILGVGFNFENPKKQPAADRTLEILVVRHADELCEVVARDGARDAPFRVKRRRSSGGAAAYPG